MARGKKTAKELTPEEKLAQALVPVEEQPYQVPENWCWVRLEQATEVLNGFAFKSKKYVDNGIRIIRIANVQDGYIEDDKPVFYPIDAETNIQKFILKAGDLLISLTGNVGRVALLSAELLPAALNQRVGCLRLNSFTVKKEFLYYYFLRKEFQSSCTKNAKGTAQLNMSTEWLKLQPIPIAPLSEQKRIVDRIKSIFSKLDEAKDRAQEVVDGFEMRKSAILYKAFTGELTKKWREEHRVTLESWRNKKINQVTVPRTGYAFESKKFCDKGYQIIRMGNLYAGQLDLSRKPVFISEDDVDDSILKHTLVQEGDILITLTGTKYKRDYGYAVCITEPEMLLLNQRILCLSTTKDVERNYILYYLKSKVFRDIFFSNETGGVNQGNVSSKFVENIEIKIPLREEQCEIVQVLERMMEMEQQAKEIAEAVIEQIDVMKKAVLARAFRGELGTNDPKEESAMELLKRVL